MKQWLDDVATYWNPQMTSWMAMGGTSQGYATLWAATAYALAENVESFLSRDVLGRIADISLMSTRAGNIFWGGSGMMWWCLAAHRFDEPEYYLRPILREYGRIGETLRFPRWRGAMGRSFWDGRVPSDVPSEHQAVREWVKSMPLSPLYYEKCFTHGPRNVPYERAFDFLVFRDPQGQEGQYLEVGGQNAGTSELSRQRFLSFFLQAF